MLPYMSTLLPGLDDNTPETLTEKQVLQRRVARMKKLQQKYQVTTFSLKNLFCTSRQDVQECCSHAARPLCCAWHNWLSCMPALQCA